MGEAPPLRRILYVEDEPDIQMLARFALEQIGGFEVKVASSGKEALGLLADHSPDLILLDVMMPEMDGPTLLGELRKRPGTATTPVVFMTARVHPPEIESYRQLGAVDVVVKPFDPMTLPQRLREVWARIHESPHEITP